MKYLTFTFLIILLLSFATGLYADAERLATPLILPVWHQTTPWNARCPGQGQTRAHAGSHALALAKTMKYWAYPNSGVGSVSYQDDNFGNLSQSFTQEINWGGMSNTQVFQTTQRFIYTCGLAAYTDYEFDFSSSSLSNVRSAMIDHFRYDATMHIEQRSDYSNFMWKSLLRHELNNQRVVIYSATLNNGRELAFIVDAYDETGLFHINFSSAEIADAWVDLNALNILDEMIPAQNQQILIGIQPSLGPESISENFEDGFGHFNWQFAGSSQWTSSSEAFYYGSHSAKSGNIDHNQSSSMYIIIDVTEDDTISFHKKVSCESEPNHLYDHLSFFIDGVELERWSGDGSWAYHSYPVTPGVHEFRWTYSKDGASVYYSDCAWVDAVTFPAGTTPLGAPRFVEAEVIEGNDIQLNWLASMPVNPGLTGYRIYRNGSEIAQFMNPSMSGYLDPHLPNGEYSYYLRALYSSGLSNPSNTATVAIEVPYAPRNLSAQVIGFSSVELDWQAPPLLRNRAFLGYYLYRDGVIVAQIENPEASSYLDQNLSEGIYYYQISALYENGESPLSNMVMAALGVPIPPANLHAAVNGNSVSLSWDQVQITDELTGFKVVRDGAVIFHIEDALQLSYIDAGLNNGQYSYAVRAVYGNLESSDSATVSVQIEVPYAPVNLSATVNGDDVQLSWQMPALVRVLTHYYIYRNGVLIAGVFNPAATRYTDLNLPNGTYQYWITAIYAGVASPPSQTVAALIEILYPPRQLTAVEIEPGQVLLNWQHPLISGGRAYLGCNLYIDGQPHSAAIPASQNSLQITLDGGQYLFELSAEYSTGESSRINTTLLVQGWLEPVAMITYSIDGNNVQLSWPAVAETNVEYLIYRNGSQIGQTIATSYNDINLSNGYYDYYLVVQYSNGRSDPSPSLNLEIEVRYPPRELTVLLDANNVQLNWLAPENSARALLGYRIVRNQEIVSSGPGLDPQFTDAGLPNGTYHYKVAAIYGNGVSAYTDSVTVQIAIQYPPESLTASVQDASVQLAWVLPAQTDFVAYRIYRDGTLVASTSQSTYDDIGLPNADYAYYVTALYDGGESQPSQTVIASVAYGYPSTLLSGNTLADAVSLSWSPIQAPPGLSVLGYELWRNGLWLATLPDTSYVDAGLANGNYSYFVKVIYNYASSGASNSYDTNVEVAYPPRNLSFGVTGDSVALTWDLPLLSERSLLSYQIYRDGAYIGQSTQLSYTDTGLANGSYQYYITALYSSGESPASNSVAIEIEVAYPPRNLSFGVTGDSVMLTWDLPLLSERSLLSYQIYRDGAYIEQSTQLSYTDTSLANGSYQYYVTALYSSGESPASNSVAIEIEVAYPPRNLSFGVTGDSVALTWDLPLLSERSLLSYQIYRDGAYIGPSTQLSYTDTGLANGSYQYYITALYSSGESPASNSVAIEIEVAYPPRNLSFGVTGDSVMLTWDLPLLSERSLLSYQIYRDEAYIGQSTQLSYTDTSLANGSYQYYITALYSSGESPASNSVAIEIEVAYPPRNLSFGVTGDSVALTWDLPLLSERSLLSYQIYRDGAYIGQSTQLIYTDTSLANGSYQYYVTALYSSGESPTSNSVDIEIEVAYPPRNLSFGVTGDSVMLTWDLPLLSERSLLSYQVYRDGAYIGQSTQLSYTDTSLANGSYQYYVTALYSSGESISSNTITADVEVAYPVRNLSASVDQDNVLLSWELPALSATRAFSGYLIYRNANLVQTLSNPALGEWLDGGLANGLYSYYVIARYGAVLALPSNTVTVEVNVMPELAPPTNLSINLYEERSAILNWLAPATNPDFYRIYRNGEQIGNSSSASFTDPDLANGSYEYYVKAQYDLGLSSGSNSVNLNLMVAYAPSSFSGTLSSANTVELAWIAPLQGEIAFVLYRNNSEYALFTDPQTTTFSDANLGNGSYTYALAAIYPDAISDFSPALSFNVELLYPPLDFSLLQTANTIDLSWNPSLDAGGRLGYRVYRNAAIIYTGLDSSYRDATLPNGTYMYELSCLYSFGEVFAPTVLSATVQIAYAASNLSVSLVEDAASLSWTASSDDAYLSTYRIYRNGAWLAETEQISYLDAGLSNGNFSYYIIAAYSFGDAEASNSVSVELELLYPPTALLVEAIEDDLHLSWTAPVNQGGLRALTGYQIYRNNVAVATSSLNSYIDIDLDNGTYSYSVAALYSSGESASTEAVSASLVLPYTPSSFSAELQNSNFALLSWQAPNQGETGYTIYRNGSVLIHYDQALLEQHEDGPLANGTYTYALTAHYGSVESLPSPMQSLQIQLAYAPSELSMNVTGNDVSLQWTAPQDLGDFTEYLLYRQDLQIATLSGTSFTDENLPNGDYSYYVQARYGQLVSSPSNTVQAELRYPYPVSFLNGSVEARVVSLQWGAPLDTMGLLNYEILRNGLSLIFLNELEYEDSMLANGSYTYTLRVHYTWDIASVQSEAFTGLVIQGYAPRELTGYVNGNDVSLAWQAPSDSLYLSGYRVYRDGQAIATITGTEYSDTDLGNGSYLYVLTALYQELESAPSAFVLLDVLIANIPQNTSLWAEGNTVHFSWDAIPDPGTFLYYRVLRNAELIYEGTHLSIQDQDLANGIYSYSVAAVYEGASSENSAPQSISVIVSYPVQSFSLELSGSDAQLTWLLPEDTFGLSSILLLRDAETLASFDGGNTNSYLDAALPNGTYTYTLRCVYLVDEFADSEEISIVVLLAYEAQHFTANTIANTVHLSWDAPQDNAGLSHYKLMRNAEILGIFTWANSFTDAALPNGSYSYSLSCIYGDLVSSPVSITVQVSHLAAVQEVTAIRLDDVFQISWQMPISTFVPDYYQIHFLPQGLDSPEATWVLLEAKCLETSYVDYDHGGLNHGNFVWAVTAKWDATAGGIPVLSNAIYVEQVPYTRLMGNYPNPFNPITHIRFWLKEDGRVELKVFNSKGQMVRNLHTGNLAAGTHSIAWDGRDDAGRAMPSGLYFSSLHSAKYHRTMKMLLSK